jgi:hypothetical protein
MKDQNQNLSNKGKSKNLEQAIQLEDRVRRSRSKHEGESSFVPMRQAQPDSRSKSEAAPDGS